MKITIYELLGLIKDGKQPKAIEHNGELYIWCDAPDNSKWYYSEPIGVAFNMLMNENGLNDTVEIIEEVEDKEYEDIQKIKLDDNDIVCFYDDEQHYVTTNIKDRQVYIPLINALIRNQKYILGVLNDKIN